MTTAISNGINKKIFPHARHQIDLETSNYIIAIIEDIDSKVAEIKEQSHSLNKDINNIKVDISRLDGNIKAMNERTDKNIAEYKVLLSDLRSELREDISDIRGDIKALAAQNTALQNKFSWNLAWVGIIMGLVLAIVQHFWK